MKSIQHNLKMKSLIVLGIIAVAALFVLFPELSFAGVVKSGFENKMSALQSKFTGVILPIMSVFGLVYAGILAATGNEGAKGKITFCIIGSMIGFLAPYIIGWIQRIGQTIAIFEPIQIYQPLLF
jgi:type IV secretory pathway VirB2 component (pilin)